MTGGTRGIGAAIAERLVVGGAEVVATGRSADSPVPSGCTHYAVDLSNRRAVEGLATWAAREEFDILINNAGINVIAAFSEIVDEDFDRIHEVNVRAPMALSRALVRGMAERGWGRIVNVTSIWSVVSKSGRASYSASKFALDGMTAALSAEVARDGVLANCVAPGVIDTALTHRALGEAGIAELIATVPAGRLGTPAEVAELVAWLAGPRNTFVSGQNVVIDGGFVRT